MTGMNLFAPRLHVTKEANYRYRQADNDSNPRRDKQGVCGMLRLHIQIRSCIGGRSLTTLTRLTASGYHRLTAWLFEQRLCDVTFTGHYTGSYNLHNQNAFRYLSSACLSSLLHLVPVLCTGKFWEMH
jgi:hypothetical protein